MAPLPWKLVRPLDQRPVVVSVTRLELKRWRDIPRFLLAALQLRRDFTAAPGAIALGLLGEPMRRTFWTLSLWQDEAALVSYARSAAHASVMRQFRSMMRHSDAARWTVVDGRRPTWREARRRLDGSVADASGRPPEASSVAPVSKST